jgi:hypothetical protein
LALTPDTIMTDSTLDRRLTIRVLNIWKRLAGKTLPRRSQIDPRDFGADWSNCLMVDLDPIVGRSRFSHVGNALRDPTWPTFDRQSISECLEGTLLELLVRHIPGVVAKKKPVTVSGSAFHEGSDILYRAIVLPLSESDKRIDGIMAAIVYREVSVSEALPEPFKPLLARQAAPQPARRNGVSR